MSELKPCPFCGGEAELHPTYDMDTNEVDGWFAWCDNDTCECKPETGQFFTEAKAIEAWNTRAEPMMDAIPMTEENMRKRGWVKERTCKNISTTIFRCSECGAADFDFDKPSYCHGCGAKVVDA